MLAHVLVLLCGCACALSVDSDGVGALGIPYYGDAWQDFKELIQALERNILSLELITGSADSPPLSDPRRHHTIIFNVIHRVAKSESGCVIIPFDEAYSEFLEVSAPEAVSNVMKVVHSVLELRDNVIKKTVDITALFDQCPVGPDRTCDIFVDEKVKKHPEIYKDQVDVLLKAGFAASQLNAQGPLYNYIAENHDALRFVVNERDRLKNPVMSLADLYSNLDNPIDC